MRVCCYIIIYIDEKVLCIINEAVLSTFPHYDTSSQLDMISHVTATVTERREVLDVSYLNFKTVRIRNTFSMCRVRFIKQMLL